MSTKYLKNLLPVKVTLEYCSKFKRCCTPVLFCVGSSSNLIYILFYDYYTKYYGIQKNKVNHLICKIINLLILRTFSAFSLVRLIHIVGIAQIYCLLIIKRFRQVYLPNNSAKCEI